MPEDIKPGSWVGDTAEEFKKLPPAGKIAVIGAFIAAAGIGFYEYRKNKSSGATLAAGTTAAGTDPNAGGGLQSPFPSIPGANGSSVPVLPSGLQAIFDGQGNLIGWQPAPTPTTPTPAPFQLPAGLAGMKVWQGTSSKNFFYGPKGPQIGKKDQSPLANLFPAGSVFSIQNGILYVLLPGQTTPTNTGIQTVSGTPVTHKKVSPPPVHKPPVTVPPPHSGLNTYTVQHGDTLSSIAARQNIKGGGDALYYQNKGIIGRNPNLIKPGQKLVVPR